MISFRLFCPAPDATGAVPEKFEELLGRLEQIVAEMESAELPLEKLLASYEEGMRLVKACGDRLLEAEQKVEILSRSLASDTTKAASETVTEGEAPSDEIRLL